MDVFMEYIIKRKRGARENILTAVIVLTALALVYFGIILIVTPLAPISVLVIAGVIVLAYYLIAKLNVEFEYIITNSDLDIDKITSKKTRNRVITIDLKKVDIIAPAYTDAHQNELSKPATNVIFADSGAAEGAYFINFSRDGQTYRVFLNPTSKMLEAMKIYAPGKVFEE